MPTRKRPAHIGRILSELEPILGDNNIELILGIDEDDDSYDRRSIEQLSGVRIVETPKTPYLSNIYNILFEYSSGEIVGYMSDDITFVNLSVFTHVIESFDTYGNILYFFSPCDAPYPHCVPDHGFVTAASARSLGFFALPNMEHGYIDHYLGRLYKETGLYVVNKTGPILHLRGPVSNDETYRVKTDDKDEHGMTCDDRDVIKFNEWVEKYLQIHKDTIISLPNTHAGT